MKGKITCLFILTLVVLIICNFDNGVDGEIIKNLTLYDLYFYGQLQPRSQGPLLPVPWSQRERETLENAGHVSPRIWEMTKHNLEGGADMSGVIIRICSPSLYVMFSHLPDSGRHVTSVFQGLSLSLSLQGT